MTTKKILDKADVEKIIKDYFARQDMKVDTIKINLISRSSGYGMNESSYKVFDNITVTIEE